MPVILSAFSREPNGVSDPFRVSDDVSPEGLGSAKAWSKSPPTLPLKTWTLSAAVETAAYLGRLWGFNLQGKRILKCFQLLLSVDLLKSPKSGFGWWETAEPQPAAVACAQGRKFCKAPGCSLPLGRGFPGPAGQEMAIPARWGHFPSGLDSPPPRHRP